MTRLLAEEVMKDIQENKPFLSQSSAPMINGVHTENISSGWFNTLKWKLKS